jgi:sec-independent protein translocase protein TatB
MLPGVGGLELVVIAIVALIVVGPKDLPLLMRKVGQFVNRMRMMASEFRASFDEMARQSELDELRKEVEALRKGQIFDPLREDLDATRTDIETGLYDRPRAYVDDTPPAEPEPEPEVIEADASVPAKPKRTRKKKA